MVSIEMHTGLVGIHRLFVVSVALLGLASCATTRNAKFVEIDKAADAGDFETALNSLEELSDDLYSKRDGVLYHLDSGMLYFYNRDYLQSIRQFSEAERLIEEYFTKSVRRVAASLVLNDNQINYAGEDFEDIYLNVFNAVGFVQQGDNEAAFVEVRRINNKLNFLEDKYRELTSGYNQSDDMLVDIEARENKFHNSALARYLSLIMYRANGDYDGARIDWEKMETAFREQSNLYQHPNPFDRSIIEPSDKARLSVLAFTGEAPLKRAETLYLKTFDDRINVIYADESDEGVLIPEGYNTFVFPGIEEGFRVKFQLPRMETRGSDVTRIRVVADGEPIGELGLLEDMERIAVDTFKLKEPLIFMKTVTRVFVKGIVAHIGKDGIKGIVQEAGGSGYGVDLIGSIATDFLMDATEQADLRVSRYFPAYTYAGEWTVEPGTYDIAIEYFDATELLRVEEIGPVDVRHGGLNFVSSFCNN